MSLIQVIETDLEAAWGKIEGTIESDAQALWGDFKNIVTALLPEQHAILSGLIARAMTDIESGDIADIETALLNMAEVQELAWAKELGSAVLQALIAVAKTAAGQVAAAANAVA
jgi:hypothetical protein